MLVLTRKAGETIAIGPDITVKVLLIDSGGQVRIGIEAPRELTVTRPEQHGPVRP